MSKHPLRIRAIFGAFLIIIVGFINENTHSSLGMAPSAILELLGLYMIVSAVMLRYWAKKSRNS